MVNRIWPTAVAGKADSVSSVSASACHIGGPNSVNPGQILLVYGTFLYIQKDTINKDYEMQKYVQIFPKKLLRKFSGKPHSVCAKLLK